MIASTPTQMMAAEETEMPRAIPQTDLDERMIAQMIGDWVQDLAERKGTSMIVLERSHAGDGVWDLRVKEQLPNDDVILWGTLDDAPRVWSVKAWVQVGDRLTVETEGIASPSGTADNRPIW